jgi:hypothetical protein
MPIVVIVPARRNTATILASTQILSSMVTSITDLVLIGLRVATNNTKAAKPTRNRPTSMKYIFSLTPKMEAATPGKRDSNIPVAPELIAFTNRVVLNGNI